MRFDRDKFYVAYRVAFPSRLSQSQVDGLNTLLSSIEADTDLSDIRHVAYMLATVKHECADTWQPIVERGSRSYFDKYEAGTLIGKRLGNTKQGDGFRFRGRGYIQITGHANYKRMSDWLSMTRMGYDLVDFPDLALKTDAAYFIMAEGMRLGGFTGKKLSDYINERDCDYTNARRIINGVDRALMIASYAQSFEMILRGSITGKC